MEYEFNLKYVFNQISSLNSYSMKRDELANLFYILSQAENEINKDLMSSNSSSVYNTTVELNSMDIHSLLRKVLINN